MVENGAIAWSESPTGVRFPVTYLAKSDPVRENGSKRRIFGEGLDVVRVEVAPAGVTAMLTREAVPQHHVESPPLKLERSSLAHTLSMLSVHVAVASRTLWSTLARHCAYQRLRLGTVTFANSIARSGFCCGAHSCAALLRHRDPTLRGWSAAKAGIGIRRAAAALARGRQAVGSTAISVEPLRGLPRRAARAPLQPRRAPLSVFFNRQANATRCNLLSTFKGHSHG